MSPSCRCSCVQPQMYEGITCIRMIFLRHSPNSPDVWSFSGQLLRVGCLFPDKEQQSSYQLVLSDCILLLLEPSEFQRVRSVLARDSVGLRAVRAANLAAWPSRFVDVRARRARPTLRVGNTSSDTFTLYFELPIHSMSSNRDHLHCVITSKNEWLILKKKPPQ